MIQVDVFWSFAMGACFAAMAPLEGLRRSNSPFVNKYFVSCIAYLSMIFAPSGIYLLWHLTSWETMFYLDRSMHGIWPCLFAHTNVSLGALGFYINYVLVRNRNLTSPHIIWVISYDIMFGILTFGYNRFLYAGTGAEFAKGVKYEITDFFHCEVFYTLLIMSIFVLPPLYYIMTMWPGELGISPVRKRAIVRTCTTTHTLVTIVVSVSYMILDLTDVVVPVTWGFDRLVAYVTGQFLFGILILVPLMLMPVSLKKKSK